MAQSKAQTAKVIHNERVESLTPVGRPLESKLLSFINHEAVVAKLANGQSVLIHKVMDKQGSGGQTVAVPLSDTVKLSANYHDIGATRLAKPGTTVGDLIKTGGTDYALVDNCKHATHRIMDKHAVPEVKK